jgi:hypothetical protein
MKLCRTYSCPPVWCYHIVRTVFAPAVSSRMTPLYVGHLLCLRLPVCMALSHRAHSILLFVRICSATLLCVMLVESTSFRLNGVITLCDLYLHLSRAFAVLLLCVCGASCAYSLPSEWRYHSSRTVLAPSMSCSAALSAAPLCRALVAPSPLRLHGVFVTFGALFLLLSRAFAVLL